MALGAMPPLWGRRAGRGIPPAVRFQPFTCSFVSSSETFLHKWQSWERLVCSPTKRTPCLRVLRLSLKRSRLNSVPSPLCADRNLFNTSATGQTQNPFQVGISLAPPARPETGGAHLGGWGFSQHSVLLRRLARSSGAGGAGQRALCPGRRWCFRKNGAVWRCTENLQSLRPAFSPPPSERGEIKAKRQFWINRIFLLK